MAEQKDTINKGAPMSNGIGGTVESGSSTGSGGGSTSGNLNTSTTSSGGNTGSTTSGSSNSGSSTSNTEYVKGAIDNYLGVSVLGFGIEKVIEIYVDEKLGFVKATEEYLEENKDLAEEEKQKVKDTIKEERDAAIKFFKEGFGKDEIKKKFDEFKSSAFQLKKEISAVPKEFTKAISEALMPNVIGPVGPNPLSIALKTFNSIARIKKVIDTVFISLQMFITVSEDLGIANTPQYNTFMGTIAGPLRALEAVMGNIKKEEEKQADNLELQAKIEEAKKNWSHPHDSGKIMTATEVEELARDDRFKMFQFPLTEDNRKDLRKFVKKGDGSSSSFRRRRGQDAEIILKYDDWTRWFAKQLNAQNDAGGLSSISSGTGQSDGTFSGDTRLNGPSS